MTQYQFYPKLMNKLSLELDLEMKPAGSKTHKKIRELVCPTGCKAGLGYLFIFMWSGGIWL